MAFHPERVLLQDFTGLPAVVDLGLLRDALGDLGGDPSLVNPMVPDELVVDHSVIAELSGTPEAFAANAAIEAEHNAERYQLLHWGSCTGACSPSTASQWYRPTTVSTTQVNLEYPARVVFGTDGGEAYPDALVGTDSHTSVTGRWGLWWDLGGSPEEKSA
ncbi:MAG: aconitase family protein [Acidimicrobiales bacterium]